MNSYANMQQLPAAAAPIAADLGTCPAEPLGPRYRAMR